MDLNVPPSPEEEDEERVESAVETLRREREERRVRLKRHQDEEEQPKVAAKPVKPVRTGDNRVLKHLPEGWINCPGAGQPVAGLIPSKVPLGESYNDVIEPGKRYSLKQVLRQQRALSRDVAMVIDLTNTTRYYPVSDWKNQGIRHVKVACKGRNEVPDNESVNTFVYEVLRFFHHNQHKGHNKHILVHCTHGHNRTGFMIVHYLVRTQGILVEQALQQFAAARHPGIYKQEYIDALFTSYHERKPELLVCPRTPEWKRPADVDLNGDAIDDEDDDGGILAALQEVERENEVMTNDDVLGDAIPYEQQCEMQKICCMSLGVPHGTPNFPGSQPVSLDRAHLQLLRQRYYYATWKADGTRYMMLITRDGCYLIDRKFHFRRVQLRFPKKGSSETQHLTLLDGEMIIDTVPETGQQKRRYLVYDLMMLNQQPLIKLPFHERWKLIEKEVVEPRNLEVATNKWYRYDMESFRVRRKDFWMLSAVGKLLRDFIPKLSHEADGLIFQWEEMLASYTTEAEWSEAKYVPTFKEYAENAKVSVAIAPVILNSIFFAGELLPDHILQQADFRSKFMHLVCLSGRLINNTKTFQGWDDPYVPRTHDGLLKWKYAHMNSVDFLFEVSEDGDRHSIYLTERGKKRKLEGAHVTFPDDQDASSFSGKIIECSWKPEEQSWEFMRVRLDKPTPNGWQTYIKVMRSIEDNITEDTLFTEIGEIIQLPMYAERISRESQARMQHHAQAARRR